jgi:hypothetical protein
MGTISNGQIIVDIMTTPGPYPPSKSPLCGKHLLIIQCRHWGKRGRLELQFAKQLGELMIQFGAQPLEEP